MSLRAGLRPPVSTCWAWGRRLARDNISLTKDRRFRSWRASAADLYLLSWATTSSASASALLAPSQAFRDVEANPTRRDPGANAPPERPHGTFEDPITIPERDRDPRD